MIMIIGELTNNIYMSKYPVEIPYTFSVDLDILESQIPFVKISVLTDNLPEETIDFTPNQAIKSYTPTWYLYGDGDLLYAGDIITNPEATINTTNRWRGKYLRGVSENKGFYWASDIHQIVWKLDNGKYRISCPRIIRSNLPYATLPYSTITIKRNISLSEDVTEGTTATIFANVLTDSSADFSQVVDGQHIDIISGTDVIPGIYEITAHTTTSLTLEGNPRNNEIGDVTYSISHSFTVAQAINSSYDVPYYFTFRNLTLRQRRRFPNVQMTTSKVWLKLGVDKYRLTVYGRFYKWTNKHIKDGEGTYIEGTYNYIPAFFESALPPPLKRYISYYKLDTFTETTRNINVYEPEYHPSNVRLLVNYVNNSGQNEVRKYSL